VRDSITGQMVNPYFAGGTLHILDILAIWKGGLGIPGAVIGGAIVLYFYSKANKINFAEWADIIAPSLALGQAVGRWGNYFNQELYGGPTPLPWGIYIEKEKGYFHPLFFYESVWNLGNMFFLLWITKRYQDRIKPGDILLIYLIVYPVGRFLLEFLRLDIAMVGGLNFNQAIMGVVAICSAGFLYFRHRKVHTT
jgi:phosphatidylglycerol:prolipoprotein diacylglycerol transferase